MTNTEFFALAVVVIYIKAAVHYIPQSIVDELLDAMGDALGLSDAECLAGALKAAEAIMEASV